MNKRLGEIDIFTSQYSLTQSDLYLVENDPVQYFTNPLKKCELIQFFDGCIALGHCLLDFVLDLFQDRSCICRTRQLHFFVSHKTLVQLLERQLLQVKGTHHPDWERMNVFVRRLQCSPCQKASFIIIFEIQKR